MRESLELLCVVVLIIETGVCMYMRGKMHNRFPLVSYLV